MFCRKDPWIATKKPLGKPKPTAEQLSVNGAYYKPSVPAQLDMGPPLPQLVFVLNRRRAIDTLFDPTIVLFRPRSLSAALPFLVTFAVMLFPG